MNFKQSWGRIHFALTLYFSCEGQVLCRSILQLLYWRWWQQGPTRSASGSKPFSFLIFTWFISPMLCVLFSRNEVFFLVCCLCFFNYYLQIGWYMAILTKYFFECLRLLEHMFFVPIPHFLFGLKKRYKNHVKTLKKLILHCLQQLDKEVFVDLTGSTNSN